MLQRKGLLSGMGWVFRGVCWSGFLMVYVWPVLMACRKPPSPDDPHTPVEGREPSSLHRLAAGNRAVGVWDASGLQAL